MRWSIVGCAIVLCSFSPALFAGDYVDQVGVVRGWTATTKVPEDPYMHRKLPGRMKSGQLSGKTKSGDR